MAYRRHSTKDQMKQFGQRVKRFRIMAGMSQKQLAKALHCALRTVQNVEGAHNEARYSTINAFNRLQTAYAEANSNPPLADALTVPRREMKAQSEPMYG